jgi:hypothetical protein
MRFAYRKNIFILLNRCLLGVLSEDCEGVVVWDSRHNVGRGAGGERRALSVCVGEVVERGALVALILGGESGETPARFGGVGGSGVFQRAAGFGLVDLLSRPIEMSQLRKSVKLSSEQPPPMR